MNRKLIIIGNEGSIQKGSFLPGVKKDVNNYLNFFFSPYDHILSSIPTPSTLHK